MEKSVEEILEKLENELSDRHQLVLYNDDVNTFEYVIECLVDICDHTEEQAEQCALTAHLRGKCSVKTGTFSELKPLFDQLTQSQLSMTID